MIELSGSIKYFGEGKKKDIALLEQMHRGSSKVYTTLATC